MASTNTPPTIEENLKDATAGYDFVFGDDIESARKIRERHSISTEWQTYAQPAPIGQ